MSVCVMSCHVMSCLSCRSVGRSVCLSVCLFVCLSICLSSGCMYVCMYVCCSMARKVPQTYHIHRWRHTYIQYNMHMSVNLSTITSTHLYIIPPHIPPHIHIHSAFPARRLDSRQTYVHNIHTYTIHTSYTHTHHIHTHIYIHHIHTHSVFPARLPAP